MSTNSPPMRTRRRGGTLAGFGSDPATHPPTHTAPDPASAIPARPLQPAPAPLGASSATDRAERWDVTSARAAATPDGARREGRTGTESATAVEVLSLEGDRTAQLNFYTWPALRLHLQRLVFELKLREINTSQSELVNALIALGPADAETALAVIQTYRERTGQAPR